jgi:hypothetical protein
MMNSKDISVEPYHRPIKCAICHNDINDLSKVYQPHHHLGVICAKCCRRFSKQDMELVLSLFMVYGGYFGELEKHQFSLIEELQKRINNRKVLRSSEEIEEINSFLLYRALIHGITPEEFLKLISHLLKENEYDYFL